MKCFGDGGQVTMEMGVLNFLLLINDLSAMARCKNAVNEQWTPLWVRAQPLVWAYIRAAVRDFQHAEDILQQVAQQTAASFDEYDTSRPFGGWAIGIAKNKVRECFRRQARDPLVFSDEALELIADSYAENSEHLTGIRQVLAWCIGQLNEQAQELLKLRYFADLKPAEIAERRQLSVNSVRIRLHRYRAALANCVNDRREKMQDHS